MKPDTTISQPLEKSAIEGEHNRLNDLLLTALSNNKGFREAAVQDKLTSTHVNDSPDVKFVHNGVSYTVDIKQMPGKVTGNIVIDTVEISSGEERQYVLRPRYEIKTLELWNEYEPVIAYSESSKPGFIQRNNQEAIYQIEQLADALAAPQAE